MRDIDIETLSVNTLIKVINNMIMGNVDAVGIGFEHHLDDGAQAFKDRLCVLTEFFQESQNSIESIAGMPANPFAPTLFYSWVDSLDISGFVADIKNTTLKPQFVLCQAQLKHITQNNSKIYLLEVNISLLHKDNEDNNAWIYPVSEHTFVLSRYSRDLRDQLSS